MKVLNLQCTQQHAFEGWFASEEDFARQLDQGLVSCPLCGESRVLKLPSAPRLNLRSGRDTRSPGGGPTAGHDQMPVEGRQPGAVVASGVSAAVEATPAMAQAFLIKALRRIISESVDVGEHFADEARAMHHGDVEQRNIRGLATPRETVELMEEGIAVMPLPLLPGLKETLQ